MRTGAGGGTSRARRQPEFSMKRDRPLPIPDRASAATGAPRTLLMGIINTTPDSFSDGGRFIEPAAAARQARALAAAGADVLDIGAESTRPGHAPLSASEELARLLPALREIRGALPVLPLSVDTSKTEVAAAALAAGADILNDVQGGRAAGYCALAARAGATLILAHNRGEPAGDDRFWDTFLGECREMAARALDAGVAPERLWLDPGFGFGKTRAQDLAVLRDLDRLVALGFPVLLGTSRKSTLGTVTGEPDPLRRQGATDATTVWGISRGAAMARVHDVAATAPVARMADAIRAGLNWRAAAGVIACAPASAALVVVLLAVAGLFAMSPPAARAAEPLTDYKTVVADEFMRDFLVMNAWLPRGSCLSGAGFRAPSRLTGGDINIGAAAAQFNWEATWEKWSTGRLQAGIAVSAGGVWSRGLADAPDGVSPPDRFRGASCGVTLITPLRLRLWRRTTFSLEMATGYQFSDNDWRYNSASSAANAPALDGGPRNWEAHVLTNLTTLSVEQFIPLTSAGFDESADFPRSPRLALLAKCANANLFGFWGRTNDQERFVNSYLWTVGAEVFLPVAERAGRLFFIAPSARFNSLHDDANRSMSTDRMFWRFGLEAGWNRLANYPKRTDGALFESDAREVSSGPDTVRLSVTGFAGRRFSGIQAAVEIVF